MFNKKYKERITLLLAQNSVLKQDIGELEKLNAELTHELNVLKKALEQEKEKYQRVKKAFQEEILKLKEDVKAEYAVLSNKHSALELKMQEQIKLLAVANEEKTKLENENKSLRRKLNR